jgi:sugar lactone lactonase YvrE
MAVASNGDVLISNGGSNQVLERRADGSLIPLAGNGLKGFSGDGGPATKARLDDPQGLVVSTDGSTYVADSGNNRIRTISPTGSISTVARVASPISLAIAPSGLLYIVDNAGVQAVSSNGAVTTVIPTMVGPDHDLSVGGTAFAFVPDAIAVSRSGAIYLANASPKVLLEYSGGAWSLVGPGSIERGTYVTPGALVAGQDGDIYVGDYGQFAIDRADGTSLAPVVTFQRNSVPGLGGIFRPSGIAIAPTGEILADTDGQNEGTNRPGLVSIDPDGLVRLLPTGRKAG